MSKSLTETFSSKVNVVNGSEKQVSWANDIAKGMISAYDVYLEKRAAQHGSAVVYTQQAHKEAGEFVELVHKTDAKTIIESKNLPMTIMLQKLIKIHC